MVQQQEQQPPSALSKLEMAQQHVKFSESAIHFSVSKILMVNIAQKLNC